MPDPVAAFVISKWVASVIDSIKVSAGITPTLLSGSILSPCLRLAVDVTVNVLSPAVTEPPPASIIFLVTP